MCIRDRIGTGGQDAFSTRLDSKVLDRTVGSRSVEAMCSVVEDQPHSVVVRNKIGWSGTARGHPSKTIEHLIPGKTRFGDRGERNEEEIT